MSGEDKLFYSGIIVFWIVLSLFAGGIAAMLFMHAWHADTSPLIVPGYFWFYRQNLFVMSWLLRATLCASAPVGAILFFLVRTRPKLYGEAHWERPGRLKRHGLRARQGIFLGQVGGKDLVLGRRRHVLLEAPTRTGKGVAIVVINLLRWAGSAVVLDMKKENYALTAGFRASVLHQRVIMFDPFEPEGRTARFNPLSYIDRTDELAVVDQLQKLAFNLFEGGKTEASAFFNTQCRSAFIGVGAMIAAIDPRGDDPGLPFTFGEFFRQFTQPQAQTVFARYASAQAAYERPLPLSAQQLLAGLAANDPRTFANIMGTIAKVFGLWVNPHVDAATSESDFELSTFRDVPTTLYLGVTVGNAKRLGILFGLIFEQLIDLNTEELPTLVSRNVPVLLVLDEFARIGRMESLAAASSYISGYGMQMLVVVQSRSQLLEIYGENITKDIVTNCGAEIVFTPKEDDVAKATSERIGTYTFRGRSKSRRLMGAITHSESEQRRPLMLPQEVKELSPEKAIIFAEYLAPIMARKLRYHNDNEYQQRTRIPAPIWPARLFPHPMQHQVLVGPEGTAERITPLG
jgi:type IV secretion system protein VirD4